MGAETERAVRLTRVIRAPRERVFAAWTRPDHMERWSCPDPTASVQVEVDLRVGGDWAIRMALASGTVTARGVYRVVDPPRRLVYTWDWEDGDPRMGVDTLVTVDFEEVEEGTRVRLVHEGFPSEDARAGHEEGWTVCLARLDTLAG